MTLHCAKGLEFPVVVLAGLEEGLFPHSRSREDEEELEEERRLCYVGITRARQQLVLTSAARRRVFGEYQSTEPSRFIDEVPAELLDRMLPSFSSSRLPGQLRRTTSSAPTRTAGGGAARQGGRSRPTRTRTRISRPALSLQPGHAGAPLRSSASERCISVEAARRRHQARRALQHGRPEDAACEIRAPRNGMKANGSVYVAMVFAVLIGYFAYQWWFNPHRVVKQRLGEIAATLSDPRERKRHGARRAARAAAPVSGANGVRASAPGRSGPESFVARSPLSPRPAAGIRPGAGMCDFVDVHVKIESDATARAYLTVEVTTPDLRNRPADPRFTRGATGARAPGWRMGGYRGGGEGSAAATVTPVIIQAAICPALHRHEDRLFRLDAARATRPRRESCTFLLTTPPLSSSGVTLLIVNWLMMPSSLGSKNIVAMA